MNIEQKQPTWKAPAADHRGHCTADDDGARWLEHVTDQQYQAAAAVIETD